MASPRVQLSRRSAPTLKIIATFLKSSDGRWWFIVLNVPMLLLCPMAEFDEAEAEEVAEPLRREWYVSGFLLRSYPIGGSLKVDGDKIPDTTFGEATGGGLKIGGFPSYKSVFGGEIEVSGHRGSITAPQTRVDNGVRSAQLDTTMINFMVNVLARYPGDFVQPYAGVGIGFSVLGLDGHTESSAGLLEPDGFVGFALQGIVGVRLIATNHLFGFVEYKPALFTGEEGDRCIKCSGSKYYRNCQRIPNCTTPPRHSLHFQSHCVAVGVGFRF